MAPSTGATSPQLCIVIAGTMGWLAPPLHRVRGVVVVSPVCGNGPPLSARVSRSPVVPDGWTVFPPIRHLAGRVQSLRGGVLPGPKMRPAISLTVFVVLEYLAPDQAAGSDGVREDEDAHPQGHFSLCHSPGVEVILGGWGCPLRVILLPPCGISRPAAGERRGTPRAARLDGRRAATAEAAMASPLHVLGC